MKIPVVEELDDRTYRISNFIEIETPKHNFIIEEQLEQISKPNYNKLLDEFSKEILDEFSEDLIKIKQEQIIDLEQQFKAIHDSYKKSFLKGNPKFLRDAVLEINDPERIKRQINKLGSEIYFIQNRSRKLDSITDEDIVRAKNFPFENLIETKNLKAICPFHDEDTPSFSIHRKQNFGHCFGCGWSGDTIQFIIDTKKINFIDAVKFLK